MPLNSLNLIEDIRSVSEDMITLLVDAGWIRIDREWFGHSNDDIDEKFSLDFRFRMPSKTSKMVCKEWKFPCSFWAPTSRMPKAKGYGTVWILHLENGMNDRHAVEVTITARGRKMGLLSQLELIA
jgi:hypothetical protein